MSFIDDVLKEKNDVSLTADQLTQIKTLLLKELNEKVNTHLVALLSEKDQIELDELLNKNVNDEELDKFFQTKIPNLIPEMTSVLLNFRMDYLYTPAAKKSEEMLMPSPAPISH